jgi:hypothetical protein
MKILKLDRSFCKMDRKNITRKWQGKINENERTR